MSPVACTTQLETFSCREAYGPELIRAIWAEGKNLGGSLVVEDSLDILNPILK